jgi:hypothetical protein
MLSSLSVMDADWNCTAEKGSSLPTVSCLDIRRAFPSIVVLSTGYHIGKKKPRRARACKEKEALTSPVERQ